MLSDVDELQYVFFSYLIINLACVNAFYDLNIFFSPVIFRQPTFNSLLCYVIYLFLGLNNNFAKDNLVYTVHCVCPRTHVYYNFTKMLDTVIRQNIGFTGYFCANFGPMILFRHLLSMESYSLLLSSLCFCL